MHYLETTRVHYAGRSYRISAYKASFSMRKVSTRLFLRNFLKRMKVFDSLISTPPRPRLFPFGEGFVWFERIASSPFTQPFCSVSGRLASPSLFSSSQKSRFLQTLLCSLSSFGSQISVIESPLLQALARCHADRKHFLTACSSAQKI